MNRMDEPDRPDDERPWEGEADDLERASENVLGWPADDAPEEAAAVDERFDTVVEPPPFEPVVPDEAAGPVAAEGAPAAEDLVDDAPGPGRGGARPRASRRRGASGGDELRARAGRPHDPTGVSRCSRARRGAGDAPSASS